MYALISPAAEVARAALVHAPAGTATETVDLWVRTIAAAGDEPFAGYRCVFPVMPAVRCSDAVLTAAVLASPHAIRLAADTAQLLAVIPAGRALTKERASIALAHPSCDAELREHLDAWAARWKHFVRPAAPDTVDQVVWSGGYLWHDHVSASLPEWLYRTARTDPSALTQAFARTPELLPHAEQAGVSVSVPPDIQFERNSGDLAVAHLAGTFAHPTEQSRQTAVSRLDSVLDHYGVNRNTVWLRELRTLLTAPDLHTVALSTPLKRAFDPYSMYGWIDGWRHTAARSLLREIGTDTNLWDMTLRLMPGFAGTLGNLITAARAIAAPAAA